MRALNISVIHDGRKITTAVSFGPVVSKEDVDKTWERTINGYGGMYGTSHPKPKVVSIGVCKNVPFRLLSNGQLMVLQAEVDSVDNTTRLVFCDLHHAAHGQLRGFGIGETISRFLKKPYTIKYGVRDPDCAPLF